MRTVSHETRIDRLLEDAIQAESLASYRRGYRAGVESEQKRRTFWRRVRGEVLLWLGAASVGFVLALVLFLVWESR